MSLKSRIERLEKKLGKPGECCCKNKLVTHYPEQPAPNTHCSICGGEKQIISIRYVKNWRGVNVEPGEPVEHWRYALPVSRSNSGG